MSQHSLTIDAWIREAQEASKLIEDLETRAQNKYPEQQQLLQRFKDISQSTLLEVGVKLDRLESLLHNPPSKPILTEEDLECRWKMLSDIQLRTRKLALSLYSLPFPPNANRPGPGSDTAVNVKQTANDEGYDLGRRKASHYKNDQGLIKPLLSVNATQNQCNSFFSMSLLWKACRILCVIVGALVVLFLLFVLCAVV